MFYLNLFKRINNNKAFLVVPNTIKKAIIKIKTKYEISEASLFKFKVVTTNELVDLLSFSIDNEIYLNNLENQQTPVSITKELIQFSKYNLTNNNKELSNFINNNSKYININKSFINSLSTYNFYLMGPNHLISPFVDYYNLNIETINPFNNNPINSSLFLTFNNKEDEVFYIMEQIGNLLDKEVDINNIFIANTKDNDYTTFNKLSSFYNIPFIFNNKTPLINIPYINKLMKLKYNEIISLLTNKEKLINLFNDDYLINKDEFNNNINTLINIFNKYPHTKYNNSTSFAVIKDEIKNTNIHSNTYTNGVKMIELDEILALSDKDHAFITNASYESFPNITKDSDYLSDTEKELINYPTSTNVNIINNNYLETLISSPAIKQISFSLKDLEGEYAASDLFSKYSNKETSQVKTLFSNINKGYSKEYYKSYFTNKTTGTLQTTFNPGFEITEEERKILSNYIKDKELKLSPTDITTYIQAPFVYYLERIIGLNTFKENVSLNLGNFFHIITEVLLLVFFETKLDRSKDNQTTKFATDEEVHNNIFNYIIELSETSKDNFDFSKYFDDFYNIYFNNELTKTIHTNNLSNEDRLLVRTLFYIKKHKNVIVDALTLLIDLEEIIPSEELIIEKPIEIDNFKGKADLIKLYNDKTYSIIDYKTGSRDAFNVLKIDELLDKLIIDNSNEEISFGALNLLQLVLYSYILSKVYSDYKLKDLSYYSYFTNKLNGITTSSLETNFYTGGKNRVIENEEILNNINNKIETLLKQTINNINSVVFNTELRRDEKSKSSLDESYYSVYEALMFFSEEGAINDEEDWWPN